MKVECEPHPQIHVLRGNSVEGSPGRTGGVEVRAGVEAPRCSDSSSTTSSVTPPDKRCDSGIHSQASYTSSSASHSKSGSSGSESCVPPPGGVPPGGVAQSNMTGVPGMGGGGVARCSSVDDLCLAPPPPPPPQPCVKSLSLQRGTDPPSATTQQPAGQGVGGGQGGDQSGAGRGTRLNIEVVGGGYRFLPPAKFVASEPVYSDASTPVVIKRRSSITVEPDTPPYERSGSSFSTFTETQLPRAVLRQGGCHAKSLTVAAHGARARRLAAADSKHATIAGATPPKGFHQPSHVDTRYFSVPAVKPPGTRVHPAPPNPPRTPSLH
ncbi:hypothetical protein Pmani_023757 [Petrolisthes manimaculis]|uniref:Uncharacterized protein n=1 Tax=Petrolisthes manimaculis TaxID=1843537 RepID=A0AAE1P963_9EUCA|nr:hypothetical protein Pmani_023757 [Petrolisthes manimaculis]